MDRPDVIGSEWLVAKHSQVTASGAWRTEPIAGVRFRPTRPVPHEDGVVTEIARSDWPEIDHDIVHVHVTTTQPGRVRAWGLHQRSTDRLVVMKGLVSIVVFDGRNDSPTKGSLNEFKLSERNPGIIVVPPNLIPTYNWATVLPWSIGSVLAQSFAEWELWVIGDGCTDESAATVATFDDPRVHWHNLAVNGRSQVGPNNAALARADGGYVAYLGHDDLWLPHHLQILVGALDAGAAFAFGRQLRIDPGQRPYVSPPDGYSYSSGDWLAPTSMMHRRDDARAVGGWRFPDAASTMDAESDLWARLTRWCGHPALLGEVTSLKLPAALRSGVYRLARTHKGPDDS